MEWLTNKAKQVGNFLRSIPQQAKENPVGVVFVAVVTTAFAILTVLFLKYAFIPIVTVVALILAREAKKPARIVLNPQQIAYLDVFFIHSLQQSFTGLESMLGLPNTDSKGFWQSWNYTTQQGNLFYRFAFKRVSETSADADLEQICDVVQSAISKIVFDSADTPPFLSGAYVHYLKFGKCIVGVEIIPNFDEFTNSFIGTLIANKEAKKRDKLKYDGNNGDDFHDPKF